ncbi:Nucleotidyltransferase [Coprinellus micaceus]|uniref:polynucleotide adenylyltransferase n=1 Tax=Coprinellus micaceus TaxID=71717 RepID=A0A4Y7ST40_COPMI|nr:Nucleotidyltransferase [Coprinellus micaceus]
MLETSVRMRRLMTLRRVQRVIDQNFYNGPQYKVETFGSTRNGLSSSESDLDIIVLDPERPNGFPDDENKKLPGIYNARRLGSLFHRAGFTEVETIPWAATPIVKFKDPVTSLHCDLNINERLGAINSDLISTYCDILPPLRPMLRSIKSWAKSRSLNNPSPQGNHPRSFSSYSLVIMTLGFLQIRGYLPNLQAGLPDKEDHRLQFWIRRPQPLLCDYRFFTQPPPGWKLPDILPQEDILRDWFRFWGDEFDSNGQMLSISQGGILERGKQSSANAPLCVIDPFIPTKVRPPPLPSPLSPLLIDTPHRRT